MRDQLAAAFPHLLFYDQTQNLIRVESREPVSVGPLVRLIEEQGAEVREAKRLQPSLEDVFVQITGLEAVTMRKEKEKKGGGDL